ncbi:MAG: glutathione S-transferase [Saprospiraceae bacterium]|jgi:glutathione S-transferase
MKLFGSSTSPFVRHCRIALLQTNLPFEMVETGFPESAEQSPMKKVPFMQDGDVSLTDSSSILKYIREKAGQDFLSDVQDYETFAMSNTLQDTSINLFIISMEGFGPDQIKYLGRQQGRVQSGLAALNDRIDPAQGLSTDGAIRAACFLAWGAYRNRFTLDGLDNLSGLMRVANADAHFIATAPPPA